MIRKASIKDIEAIYSLLQEGINDGKILKRSKNELVKIIDSFFVLEDDNKIVGCCSLEVYSKKLAEVRSLVVCSEYRNRGIGSQLIQRCLDVAKNKGIYQVVSVTDKCDLFRKFGFKTELNEKQVMFKNLTLKVGE